MNILILCNSYPTPKNPHHQIFIKNMKEHLEAEEGVQVDVCYNRIYDFWEGANKSKDLFSNLVKYSVFILSILFFLLANRKKFDILFPQAVVFPTVFAAVLKKLLGIPLVCYVHGGDVNSYPEASFLYKQMMEKALLMCDTVIVNSRDMEQKVMRIADKKNVQIISPGVDTDVMRPLPNKSELRKKFNLPQDKQVLLAAGNAIKRKGFDVFIKAVYELEESTLDKAFALIITEGPQKENLQRMIEVRNLSHKIIMRNKVGQKQLNEYYNAADIFIFPSREEPLGLVGLEAMAAGAVVIAANVGGIPDYIQDQKNGFLFERENHLALSQKIAYALSNPLDSFQDIYKNMKPTVNFYSIHNSVKKMISLFETFSV